MEIGGLGDGVKLDIAHAPFFLLKSFRVVDLEASLGAREIPRAAFEHHLALTVGADGPANWTYDSAQWAQLGLVTRSEPGPA